MVIKPLRKILRSQMLLNKISKVEWLHNLNARAVGKYILLWKAKTNPHREIILMYAPTCLSYTFKILLPYFVFYLQLKTGPRIIPEQLLNFRHTISDKLFSYTKLNPTTVIFFDRCCILHGKQICNLSYKSIGLCINW